ncbi:hypothetical protein EVAR_28478_1 [Eumeta japonica]|uniref:Uncharacterized protein n=1 Tax=Eumeta variegata TaxID=151549 RepID=A0A4C1WNS3_EUMVA|nr:hypothetical protein EVAR_28478_1 [Eumeta japonica]
MSIKSQKELYEECSEIFEKSYSVRSLSDESSSGCDEDELLARELLVRLSPAVLSKLRKKFSHMTMSHDDDIQRVFEISDCFLPRKEQITYDLMKNSGTTSSSLYSLTLGRRTRRAASVALEVQDVLNVLESYLVFLKEREVVSRAGGILLRSKVEVVMAAAAAAEGVEFPAQARAHGGLAIDSDTFLSSIHNIFDGPKYTVHAEKLFSLLDPFRTGKIWWGDLLDELVKIGARKTRARADVWATIAPKHMDMKRMAHCRRETIVALVSMENEGGFCYAAVSRGGRVGLYPGALGTRPLTCYRALGEGRQRVRNTWITDAVYMTLDCKRGRDRVVDRAARCGAVPTRQLV